jgi:hypothetical protein
MREQTSYSARLHAPAARLQTCCLTEHTRCPSTMHAEPGREIAIATGPSFSLLIVIEAGDYEHFGCENASRARDTAS